MSLNWVEIDEVLKELSLEGCFLQNARQADYHHLYLEFYKPGRPIHLLVCLAQGKTRIHEVTSKPQYLAKAPRFVQFLRSRLVGGRLLEARQIGHERLVLFRFGVQEESLDLWIRLWGGAANILVTDAQGIILEAAFRRPGSGEVKEGLFQPEKTSKTASEKTFALRNLPGGETYNRKLEVFYANEGTEDLTVLRERANKLVERRLNAVAVSLEKARTKLTDYERQDDWKVYGDLITSDAFQIEKGALFYEGVDYRDGTTIRLDLNPKLSPHENAQVYYRKHRKARDGVEQVREEMESLLAEESEWRRQKELFENADVLALKKFLDKHKSASKGTTTTTKSDRPGLEFASGSFVILVGRNAKENDALLRSYVRGNDVWMHTRDVPGGYVFVRSQNGKTIPLETLLDAGNLAVWYSKAKGEGRADLYYTAVKYLRRSKDGPLGLVLPTQEKNLAVVVDRKRIERLHSEKEETA